MNMMTRGAKEANEESDRMSHARTLGTAAGNLLAALNTLPTTAEVRMIVRDEIRRFAGPITRCAADQEGDCMHLRCPQLADHEPAKTGRHCPLDQRSDGE